jgi:hypothetical protein
MLVVAASLLLTRVPASAASLRGFGEVTSSPVSVAGLAGVVFHCDSPVHAVRLRQKLGRDFEQSATVAATWSRVDVAGKPFAVLSRPGIGSYLFASAGSTVYALTTGSTSALITSFESAAATLGAASGYDAAFVDDTYIDKFDHTGIGTWYPQAWGDKWTKGHVNTVDEHFAYAHKWSLTLQPNGGGPLLENLLPKIHEYSLPYHFAQWQDWSESLALLAPGDLFQPSPLFTYAPNYYGQVSFGSQKLEQYRNWEFQETMRKHVDDPLLVDWLDPNGEVDAAAWLIEWDASENNRLNYVKWLQGSKRYTPATLGEAWYGDPKRIATWDDVKLPLTYEFYGMKPGDIVANKTWRVHQSPLDAGLKLGYQSATLDSSKWPSFQMPGGEMPAIVWRSDKPTWYRGSIDVTAKWLADRKKLGRIYLNVASLSSSRGWRSPDRLWVNGQEAGALSASPGVPINTQLDVTGLLHAGANTIAYLPANTDSGITGVFFLTSTRHEDYPFRDNKLNARYIDWHDYIAWAPLARVETTLKAMRGIDPHRAIKVHAAQNKDLFLPMIAKYGGYPHNTGEGGFLRSWDKRLGYPWGIPASAEFGGPIYDAQGLKRWIGFFSFEGLNAFDQFHNIQGMMYPEDVKDIWTKYMPYLHLANRWDIRKPDIALVWSSRNSRLLPRSLPYVFDLGRGDLQSIGYSYIYLDEASLAAGLAKDYPIVWDNGTAIMSKESVADITKYVKSGGTFVALQDTGRHTYHQRDAWPISSLTGFCVREVRGMTGVVSILKDQPIFTKLAGQSFYNVGKSVDYSSYNYADHCLVLDSAAPDTQVLARYDDGNVAIGMRKVGKGRVIVLGSPFWRDSYDQAGYWHPGEGQSAFLEDMLHGLGLEPLSASTNHAVWRERYTSDNGTEEYMVLWNQSDQVQTADYTWRTDRPATALYDPKDGRAFPASVAGNTVTLNALTLQPNETLILATQPNRDARETVDSWFAHLSLWWRSSAPGEAVQRPAVALDEVDADTVKGRIVPASAFAALDLASLSTPAGEAGDWNPKLGFIRPENLNIKTVASDHIVYRTVLPLPASWKQGDKYRVEFKPVYATGYPQLSVWLNGAKLDDVKATNRTTTRVDATAQVRLGAPNVLVIVAPSDGYLGSVSIERQPAAAETIMVTGKFANQQSEDSGQVSITLPGKFSGLFATKSDVAIPASWRGSNVFIRIQPTDPWQFDSFAINGKVVFTPVSWHAPITYMDITPWVKFGSANTLTLLPHSAAQSWTPGPLGITSIALERVPTAKR